MNGQVDDSGRALVGVSVQPSETKTGQEIQAWIDTGFTGDLVLPEDLILKLGLRHSGTVKAMLADGSEVTLKTYACLINWFGEDRYLEVVGNDGEYPLLGVGLLFDHDLSVSYRTGKITIN